MPLIDALQKSFWPFKTRARWGPIGLQCALKALHLVQLEKSQEQIVLRAKASLDYPDSHPSILDSPATFKALVQQAFKTQPFEGRTVVTAMPANHIVIAPMTYQVTSGETDQSVILKLLAERSKDDLSKYVVDYLPLRTVESGQKLALVVTSKKDLVIQYLELLRQAGLKVEALEIGATAICRLVGFVNVLKKSPIACVINVGSLTSYITVIADTELLFDEELQFGEKEVLKQLSKALDMTPDSIHRFLCHRIGLLKSSSNASELEKELAATVREIVKPSLSQLILPLQRTMGYVTSLSLGGSIEHIYIAGSMARWKGIERYLSELFNLPVSVIPDLKWSSVNPESKNHGEECKAPEIAVAAGLALRGLIRHD